MNYIKRIYKELEDLYKNIKYIDSRLQQINCEWEEILEEIKDTNFNAIEGVELYKKTQEFLQERRLLKMQKEELDIQFRLLGGKSKLKHLKDNIIFKPKKNSKDGKNYRNYEYFKNFNPEIKEKLENVYHVKKR